MENMKTHLRSAKNNTEPACGIIGHRTMWIAGREPKKFMDSGDKCKKCEEIFNKRRDEQRTENK